MEEDNSNNNNNNNNDKKNMIPSMRPKPEVRSELINQRKHRTRLDITDSEKPLLYGTDIETAVSIYRKDRDELFERGRQLSFKYNVTETATLAEQAATEKLRIIRRNDELAIYRKAPKLTGYGSQEHLRFAGDHFLTNASLIERTALFKVAQHMPKGAHLHIHFNSMLPPHFLLGVAAKQCHMYIWSNKPLTSPESLDQCEIQFSIKSHQTIAEERRLQEIPLEPFHTELRELGALDQRLNLLSSEYLVVGDSLGQGKGQAMNFQHFRRFWNEERKNWRHIDEMRRFDIDCQDWLVSKLVFDEQEAHNVHQSATGYVKNHVPPSEAQPTD